MNEMKNAECCLLFYDYFFTQNENVDTTFFFLQFSLVKRNTTHE